MIDKKRLFLVTLAFCIMLLSSACAQSEKGQDQSSAPAASSASERAEEPDSSESTPEESDPDAPTLKNFKTTDLDGNEVTQEIFSHADLTMINIWATYCNP